MDLLLLLILSSLFFTKYDPKLILDMCSLIQGWAMTPSAWEPLLVHFAGKNAEYKQR